MKENFGKRGTDKVTGFNGIIIGYTTYITGCDQYLLQPMCAVNDDTKRPKGEWIDAGRIEISETISVDPKRVQSNEADGADIPAPIR
jgi:hypothetical protein